jgi:hypothetical protein
MVKSTLVRIFQFIPDRFGEGVIITVTTMTTITTEVTVTTTDKIATDITIGGIRRGMDIGKRAAVYPANGVPSDFIPCS